MSQRDLIKSPMCTCPERGEPDWNGHHEDGCPWLLSQRSPRDLIKQGLEHDERMSETPWYASNGGLGVTYGADREWVLRIARATPVSDAAGIAWLRNNARALLTGYAAALDENERLGEYLRVSNGARMFDQLGADRMADEIDALIKRRVIDSRSPAADALLDYRDPPRTPRSDRLGALEAERDTWSRDRGEFNRLKHSDVEQGRRIAELLAENDRLRAELAKFKEYDWNVIP